MITLHQSRFDGYEDHQYPVQERKVVQALWSALHFELGFGGRVVDFEPTRIVIRTPVFGKVDTSTFTGSKEEMRLLAEGVGLFLAANRRPEDATQWVMAAGGKDGRISPMIATMLAPWAVSGDWQGKKSRLIIAGLVLGEDEERLETFLDRAAAFGNNDDDFLAAMELIHEGVDPSELLNS